MILKSIGARNVLGYKSVDLEVQPGLTLIDGVNHHYAAASSNGSGKSTLQEIFSIASFGRTVRPIVLDKIIRRGASYYAAWAELVQGNGHVFRIERYRHHPKYGSKVRLLLDGNDSIDGRYIDPSNEAIVSRLGFDYELFIRSILIHSRVTESFVSINDRYLKMITEKLIGMPDFDALQMRVKDETRDTEYKIENAEIEIKHLETLLASNQKNLKSYKEKFIEHQKERDKIVRMARLRIIICDKRIRQFSREIVKLTERMTVSNKKLSVAEEIDKAHREVMVQCKARMEALTAMKVRYRKFKDVCPECEQKVSKQHVLDKIAASDNEYGKLVTELALHRVAESRNDNEVRATRNRINEIARKIADLKTDMSVCRQEKKQKEETVLERQADPYAKLIEDARTAISKCKASLEHHRNQRAKKRKTLLYYEFWKRGFGPHGIRSYILDAVLPVLNRNANLYLDTLSDGNMRATMISKKDKFVVEVENLSGADTLAGDSDGEMHTLDLAVNFAMSDILETRIPGGFGFMILDQALDLVDLARGRKAIQLLNNKLNPKWCEDNGVPCKRSIWLITHREQLKGLIENRIMVEKKDKVCRITATE